MKANGFKSNHPKKAQSDCVFFKIAKMILLILEKSPQGTAPMYPFKM
jgi:hypothetical protein